jgi:hypothetical protein
MLKKNEQQNLAVLKATKKITKIIEEIGDRGGFNHGNIELIEDAIAEIDALIMNEEYAANAKLSAAIDQFQDSYKRLRKHYARLTT